MGMDTAAIMGGAVAGLLSDKAGDLLNTEQTTEELLKDIHMLLVELSVYYKGTQSVEPDQYKYVTLYKAGLGEIFIPRFDDWKHIQVLSGPNVTLDAVSSGLGSYTIALTGGMWKTLDYPEGTQYTVDTTYANNSIILFMRQTNQDIQ